MNIDNNEENRRWYRQMLFRTKECSEHLSAIILCHETFYHRTDDDGAAFPRVLQELGILPGITVDRGLIVLGGTDNETTTQGSSKDGEKENGVFDRHRRRSLGLDGLEERCREYKKNGAQFAKWRALLRIAPNCPSQLAINENASKLARYASICQQVSIFGRTIVDGVSHCSCSSADWCRSSNRKFRSTVIMTWKNANA